MSGQSITDRIAAAQHSMTGSAISKAVCKATTHEVSGPKKKHLDYLIHCTNEMNVNIPQLADTLFERTANSSWVVVFKALITTHHLMMYGNERFTQYLASRNTLFNLNNFLDKGALQGYDMSTFIRRYSRYLNEKAMSYRLVAVDFTKMKRGIDGVMRTMNIEKLIKTLPIVQNQLDALLDFQANPNELTNGVINSAFMLLFKDSIRLFAAYNEGVINLLEKYFDMKKNQCKDALDIYKKFLYRMTKLSEFLKVAEQVGIDQGDIPDLSQAPSSLLEALEQHLASLEGKKTKELNADTRASTLSSAVSSLSSTGMSFSRMDEKEKQQALEEEQARLQALKDQRLKEINMHTPPSASPSSQSMGANNNNHITQTPELFSSTMSANSVPNLNSDLFDLQPAFIPTVQSTPSISTANSAWGGMESQPLQQTAPAMTVDFDAVFGNKATPSNNGPQPAAGFDALGDLLKPTIPTHTAPHHPPPPQMVIHHGGKLLANDLDSSLANLVGNLQFGGTPAKKPDMHWSQPGEKKLTGGQNWQNKTMSTTQWTPAPMAPQPMPVQHVNGMFYTSYAPAPMAFPMTTPQVPVYGMVPPQMGQMGGVPVMAPQPMMYNQPVLRPTNPFATMPGAQMQFM
ncbi:phosphatidylinositol-binding clathrin assembly protein isoform X1 [Siniperca chuatsi]|uniref:phosphatidylinositol-binding clathrin assembly protein isoform X1 n=1 Tax=Siniperca chuatsi TaxID=119488 RepID=UPI001CE167DE|nr:phosphatidylinositol-binding clathrin assembly protein isoform X1 [Siniperca chuatsi]XP_044040471.1 phosphatidylinositol-binding clathrin assembly protein isoform X1 [Siniperca chuatsi]XP_044040472.1 phosphatidylinositol-binding clathrin assembly protein isoform X1 [Siniperca chuatsi]